MLNLPDATQTWIIRQQAKRPALKIGNTDKGKLLRKSGTARASYGTHTTLPLCIPAAPANPQKTAIYAPRRKPSGACKAAICNRRPYFASLETAYFNALTHRPVLSPLSREAR